MLLRDVRGRALPIETVLCPILLGSGVYKLLRYYEAGGTDRLIFGILGLILGAIGLLYVVRQLRRGAAPISNSGAPSLPCPPATK